MRRRLHLRRLPAAVLTMTVFLSFAVAQSPAQKERPKLKDFGSSLDQLKWDPGKKAAVERVRSKETDTVSSEDDVIRTETDLVTSDILVVDRKGDVVSGLKR